MKFSSVLLVPGEWEPVSNYKLKLVREASRIVNPELVVFFYDRRQVGDSVFSPEERKALLESLLVNNFSTVYLTDEESFVRDRMSFLEKIQIYKSRYRQSDIYLLLDTEEFKSLLELCDLTVILALVKVILYVLPGDRELLGKVPLTIHAPLLIESKKELDDISQASILSPVTRDSFADPIIDYINKSSECAIKRIKAHLSDFRFKHSLRVADTSKKIFDLLIKDNDQLKHDLYMAAIYHDICKEFKPAHLVSIAEKNLKLSSYSHVKVLHGPVASWYLKSKYLYTNEDVLEAISQHTIPAENPKVITKLLYLADHLEPAKRNRYPEDIYSNFWNLINQGRLDDAFNAVLEYSNTKKQ